MPPEPDGAGSGQFNATISTPGRFGGKGRTSNVSGGMTFDIPGVQQVAKDLGAVSEALKDLKSTLAGMSSAFSSGPVVNILSAIRKEAVETSQSLRDLSSAVGGVSSGGGGGGGGGASRMTGNSTSSNAGIASATATSAGAAVAAAGGFGKVDAAQQADGSYGATSSAGKGFGKVISAASGAGLVSSLPLIGGLLSGAADIAMFPLRFARERIQNNRTQALGMSQELTPYQWQTGVTPDAMMRKLSESFPGKSGSAPGIQGDVADILNALTIARRTGAQYDFGNADLQNSSLNTARRSQSFFQGVAQMQQITPGIGAGGAAAILGGQVSNTKSQQAAAFYTGGSFSMIKMGGGQKNIREWGEGILRFLEGQRPGAERGKRFKYGELLAQNFPGSNVNAWFDTVGISEDMRDYFWSYAMGQAQSGSDTNIFEQMGGKNGQLESNQGWRRMASQNVLARNDFGLAGRMGGQYATRERSNQWFNQAMGATVNRLIPAMANSPILGQVQYLPDQVEDFMWNTLESSGDIAQLFAGAIGTASTLMNPAGLFSGYDANIRPGRGTGDPGDIGDVYDSQGGRSTSGLAADLRPKIEAMMKANPNLRINSGLRDSYTQSKLKKKGIGQFGAGNKSPHSGGWAADIGPKSQYGWMQANASRFGLDTAASHGEPWHVQRAGSITPGRRPTGKRGMGDPSDDGIGDRQEDGGAWWKPSTWWSDFSANFSGNDDGSLDPTKGLREGLGKVGDLAEMFFKVFHKTIQAFDSAADMAKMFAPGSASPGAAGVQETSMKFMSLLTGDVSGDSHGFQTLLKGNDSTIGYNAGFDKGLSTDLTLFNLRPQGDAGSQNYGGGTFGAQTPGGPTPGLSTGGILGTNTINTGSGTSAGWGGGGGAFGSPTQGVPADLAAIYQKYAIGGQAPSQSKSVDAATRQGILNTLGVASGAGMTGNELIAAVSLAGRESNFNPQAFNGNAGTGDLSYGLWQINMLGGIGPARRKALGISSNEELFNPEVNAKAMKQLFDGSKTPFYAWGPYRGDMPLHGGAEKWVAPVYAIAKEAGYIGDPGESYAGAGATNVTFHNTFNLGSMGGGNSGSNFDINRLVPLLATKLEEDMKRRLATVN